MVTFATRGGAWRGGTLRSLLLRRAEPDRRKKIMVRRKKASRRVNRVFCVYQWRKCWSEILCDRLYRAVSRASLEMLILRQTLGYHCGHELRLLLIQSRWIVHAPVVHFAGFIQSSRDRTRKGRIQCIAYAAKNEELLLSQG